MHLTFYEVGNVIWKESYLHKKVTDPVRTAEVFEEIMKGFRVLEDPPIHSVLKIAVEKGLTYYDASYVYSSEVNGLTLVSEDKELITKTDAIPLREFLKEV